MDRGFWRHMVYEMKLVERCLRNANLEVEELPDEHALIYTKIDGYKVKVTFEELDV